MVLPALTTPAVSCRACGGRDIFEVLDMGLLPLAGDFRGPGERNDLYPLAIDGCSQCGLLQVRQTVPLERVFGPGYSYASSTVPALVGHFDRYARERNPGRRDRGPLLLEVGCNDGVFLEPLRREGFRVVGIDASDNVASLARQKGLNVTTGMFDRQSALNLRERHGRFDVVTCSNVFAHNPALDSFMDGVDEALTPGGEFWIEVHDARGLFAGLQWDCFYHEHSFYWTIHSLSAFLARRGYRLRDYRKTAMHGGGLRTVWARIGEAQAIREEPLTPADWSAFAGRALRNRELIGDVVRRLDLRFSYGAAGRAVILINWAHLGDALEYVVDGSPLRAGKLIPNTVIPVISEERFFSSATEIDWCFVTAHNYLDGIRRKIEAAFPGRLVRLVTPLPHVAIQ